MYNYTNAQINEMLAQEGFRADLDETKELEVVQCEINFEDEMESGDYE